jgi:hypothetical protein
MCGRHACKISHEKVKDKADANPKIKAKSNIEANPKIETNPTRYIHSENLIGLLCRHINEMTPLGERACRLFKESGGGDIIDARPSGGSRFEQFDFTLTLSDGRLIQVEAKGSKRKCVTTKEPWHVGVQMYNGTGSQFSLARKYSTMWYERFIASGYTTSLYGIDTAIPSYDEWVKDVFSQTKGKSEWTNEIRRKQPSGFSEERIDFAKVFSQHITEDDKHTLAKEVIDMATRVLDEKQYWVHIHSDLDGISDIKWTPPVRVPSGIPTVVIKPCKDVSVSLTWDDGRSLHTILRWGYNQGISNLRMDIK